MLSIFCSAIFRQPKRGFRRFISMTALPRAIEQLILAFHQGVVKTKSVEGFSITANLLRRLRDRKSAQTPSNSRSHGVRFGTRRCERLMMSNWCLTGNDSAATAPRPPGLASFADLTSRWAITMKSSRMNANFSLERRFLKTALQKRFQAKSTIRHRQVCARLLLGGRSKREVREY
jgi:hypothetical protein